MTGFGFKRAGYLGGRFGRLRCFNSGQNLGELRMSLLGLMESVTKGANKSALMSRIVTILSQVPRMLRFIRLYNRVTI
jgi:hypothetical protein